MTLNWIALVALLLTFGDEEVLTVLALASIALFGVLRLFAVWLAPTDRWVWVDVLSLAGLAWAGRLIWVAS
jgi:hypothetical protein